MRVAYIVCLWHTHIYFRNLSTVHMYNLSKKRFHYLNLMSKYKNIKPLWKNRRKGKKKKILLKKTTRWLICWPTVKQVPAYTYVQCDLLTMTNFDTGKFCLIKYCSKKTCGAITEILKKDKGNKPITRNKYRKLQHFNAFLKSKRFFILQPWILHIVLDLTRHCMRPTTSSAQSLIVTVV